MEYSAGRESGWSWEEEVAACTGISAVEKGERVLEEAMTGLSRGERGGEDSFLAGAPS